MAPNTTRLIVANLLEQFGTVKNNGVGLSPPREEDPLYPMENAFNGDRFSPWRTSAAPPEPTSFDADMGANRTVNALGILGLTPTASSFPTTLFPQYSVNGSPGAGVGYPPTSWNPFNPATISINGLRDAVLLPSSPVTARYVRFDFLNVIGFPFSVGRLFVASTILTMGVAYSPNAEFEPVDFWASVRTTLQNEVRTKVALPAERRFCDFLSVPTATLNVLRNSAALGRRHTSFILLSPFDEVLEVFGRIKWRHSYGDGSSDLWDVRLEMEQLP